MAEEPLVNQGLFIVEASRSDTSQSVGLLWTSDQSDAQTTTWQPTTLAREREPCPQRNRNLSKRAAADPRLESRARWDGPKNIYYWKLYSQFLQRWYTPIFVSYRANNRQQRWTTV